MRTRRQRSSSDPMSLNEGHRPVLLHESLENLAIEPDDIVLDATLGGAGHAKEIVKLLGTNGIFIGIDADKDAIARAEEALKGASAKVILIHGNFRDIESHLGKHEIQHVTKAFFDLGWSSFQLAAGRGFSFLKDEPLLMTYADSMSEHTLTARTIVNTWGEESIADIIKDSSPPFYRKGRIHPATKTFQALRIAVNDEMGALKQGLASVWKLLQQNGRLAVISFHSVEDREVKRFMLEKAQKGEGLPAAMSTAQAGERITKSPIRPSHDEVLANPRSRSAKLRVIRKL